MNNSLKVSIVVPIYNVEKYLDRCLNSIVNQTYSNLEIILVDDESPDNCPKICEEWAKKDSRIKVIHKKNAGLGMARNTGIEAATGDYICFVDSDDLIDNNSIELALDEKFDVICFGYKRIDENDNIFKRYIPTPLKEEYYNSEVFEQLLPSLIIDMPKTSQFNLCFSAWACIISMDVIKKSNWKFVSEREIISEDLYSLMYLYKNVKSVKVIKNDLYSYRVNNNSLSRTYKDNRFERIKKLYISTIDIYSDERIKERIKYLFLSFSISCLKLIVESEMSYKDKIIRIKNIILDDELRKNCKYFIKKDSFIRKIYLISILLKIKCFVYFLTYLQIKKDN